VTAIVAVVFAGGWLVFLFGAGGGLAPLGDSYRVQAIVPTAVSVASNARVTMAGVDVGRVESVDRRGLGAVVKLEIDNDEVVPIPADSRVAIRQRTPIGENYVSIDPGSSHTDLPSGGTLAVSQADPYVDQVLSILQGDTRWRAREFIQGFGRAIDGRGVPLNRLLDGTAKTMEAGGRVTDVLSRDREQVGLVQQFGDISRSVGDRGAAIRQLAHQGVTTFEAIADRDNSVRAFLDELPPTLAQLRSTTTTLGHVTDRATPCSPSSPAPCTSSGRPWS
jgi:phospholipid/cholesterol/gamma-HCH transport system substrate-binding protein